MLTAEQVLAAQKANLETLFGLTNKAFEGVEKLVELNLQVAKTALSEAADTTAAALSVKDAQELLALQAALLQPTAEKAASYSRHLYDIASSTGAEVAKAAEIQFADAQQKFSALVASRQGLADGDPRQQARGLISGSQPPQSPVLRTGLFSWARRAPRARHRVLVLQQRHAPAARLGACWTVFAPPWPHWAGC